VRQLAQAAGTVSEVSLPVSTDRTLQSAESYQWHRESIASSPELYHPETLRRLRTGENISADEYREALDDLLERRRDAARIFEGVDILVTPTVPFPAPSIAELTRDLTLLRPVELMLLRNTRPVNVWGLPAISVPCGRTQKGLPISLQIVGPPGGEGKVLRAARRYERQACASGE
jgi:aspartyl-tRNA(Asn)/glutamyl-tRNA(Gln) amidotransferase subunit A